MKKFLNTLFKMFSKRTETIPYLSLHMQHVTNQGWLVRLQQNQRLQEYAWHNPENE